MEPVLEQFRRFDQNGDGAITKAELAKVLKALEPQVWTDKKIRQLMSLMDRNGDGFIQFEESVSWCFGHEEGTSSIVTKEAREGAIQTVRLKARAAHSAARQGDWVNVFRVLRETPECLQIPHGTSGDSLLHQAGAQGDLKAITHLMHLKADPTVINKDGLTAMEFACELRQDDAAELIGSTSLASTSPAGFARGVTVPSSKVCPDKEMQPTRSYNRVAIVGV
mmetsp:Transcript_117020/g.335736  ORF Transcript_117020/g.335736 Transcript_117020/m.335736 type:complete len:223 (+) Transcript_117020:142-810(+)